MRHLKKNLILIEILFYFHMTKRGAKDINQYIQIRLTNLKGGLRKLYLSSLSKKANSDAGTPDKTSDYSTNVLKSKTLVSRTLKVQ